MKKLFVLPALIVFAAISSCQKNDSTVDQQAADRTAQLDAREKALDAREKALETRERVTTDSRAATGLQAVPPDAQADLKRLIPDPAHVKAERQRRLQERIAQRQRKLEEIQQSRVSGAAATSAGTATADASAGTASGTEDVSPSPSATPQ
ncbi:MAG TPA: hypothetical protein VH254_08015 [Candidatus Udaeobacter sp.]|jgi:hypothetical protein|nr:hypothetical protein [Candidatus Udaeobacter sp.]